MQNDSNFVNYSHCNTFTAFYDPFLMIVSKFLKILCRIDNDYQQTFFANIEDFK